MTHLADKICTVASENENLSEKDIPHYRAQIHSEWQLKEEKLKRRFNFKGFNEALEFIHDVSELIEREGHHPEITLNYGEAELEFSTPEVNGLHENDFIMAAKIDRHHTKHTKNKKSS